MGVEMTLLRMLAFKPVNSEGLNTAPPAQPGSANPLEQNRDKQVTPTQIASEDAAPAITATEQSKKPELLNDWSAIVTELKLGGLLNQLAMNCSLLEKSDDRIVLALDPTFENLLTKERQENLKEALTSFYNKNVLLEIEVKQAEKETPAMQEKREEQARLDAAQQAIEDDANVKKILDTFQAQISTDTIQPK
jgi:DNA polymerase-3 subunit gamma/tau